MHKEKKNLFHTIIFAMHMLLYGEHDRGNMWIRRGFSETHKSCCRYDHHIAPDVMFQTTAKIDNTSSLMSLFDLENMHN